MALIGGYAGIIWALLGTFIGFYQTYAYDMSLLRLLYTTNKKKREFFEVQEDDRQEVDSIVKNT